MDNQQSYWYTGQIVTAQQMTDYSQDVYTRLTQITQQQTPCILNIGSISQVGGNVSVGAGSFRFTDTTYGFLSYDTGIFGNAPAATVAVSGNGFIVARYVVSPTSPNETNYTFTTQYLFVASINAVTDVVVCNITSGLISSYGTFFNYFPHFIDDVFNETITVNSKFIVDVTFDGTHLSLDNHVNDNEWNMRATDVATNNQARILAFANVSTGETSAALVSINNNVEAYRIAVYNAARPELTLATGPLPAYGADDVLVGSDLTSELASYVTFADLTSELAAYATLADLTAALAAFITVTVNGNGTALKFQNGYILQFFTGPLSFVSGVAVWNFPISFTNVSIISVQVNPLGASDDVFSSDAQVSGGGVYTDVYTSGLGTGSIDVNMFAIGR